MSNPLRFDDPTNQFPPDRLIDESSTGTRHPGRFEARASIPNTQEVRQDTVRVYRNAALSVATNDFIPFDIKVDDTTGVWNGSTSFIIPSTGKITGPWSIHAQVAWPGTGGGSTRQIAIVRNGIARATFAGPADTTSQDVSDIINDPSGGDIIKVIVFHDAGGLLALNVGIDQTFFSMIHTG